MMCLTARSFAGFAAAPAQAHDEQPRAQLEEAAHGAGDLLGVGLDPHLALRTDLLLDPGGRPGSYELVNCASGRRAVEILFAPPRSRAVRGAARSV